MLANRLYKTSRIFAAHLQLFIHRATRLIVIKCNICAHSYVYVYINLNAKSVTARFQEKKQFHCAAAKQPSRPPYQCIWLDALFLKHEQKKNPFNIRSRPYSLHMCCVVGRSKKKNQHTHTQIA